METTKDEAALKQLLKEAIVEVLQERSDLISGAVEDVLEEARLLRAMEEARGEGLADRDAVANVLGVRL